MKNRSNLDMIGADIAMFCLRALLLSYLPPIGLAAAKIDVLALSVACQRDMMVQTRTNSVILGY